MAQMIKQPCMGIKGLTGYVASRQAHLGKRHVFGSSSNGINGEDDVDLRDELDNELIIIDASAWVYRIYKLHLEWTAGGDVLALEQVISAYLAAFANVHLTPVFVWDGAYEPRKLETVKARLQQSIRHSVSYFRSSASLRSHRGFKAETSLLPQLALRAAISLLHRYNTLSGDAGVEMHFPPGEADAFIADLAIKRNAYILSLDSDFFITNHGCKGYIPLDSLTFYRYRTETLADLATESLQSKDTDQGEDDGGEWAPVTSRATRRNAAVSRSNTPHFQSSTINQTSIQAFYPIDFAQANSLHCKMYKAPDLAISLGLPSVAYLPICASLAGNDYYIPPIWRSSGSPPGTANGRSAGPSSSASASGNTSLAAKRFEYTAASLVKLLKKARRGLEFPTASMSSATALAELYKRVIDDVREFAITESQIADIAARAMDTLPEYCVGSYTRQFGWLRSALEQDSSSGTATPLSSAASSATLTSLSGALSAAPLRRPSKPINPLHALLLPSSDESISSARTKLRIYNAYESGHFRNSLLQLLTLGVYTTLVVLEDPERTSCAVSVGRGLRVWIYAILQESVGLGGQEALTTEVEENKLVDANESVAPSDVPTVSTEASGEQVGNKKPTTVVEYVRRNMSLAEEGVEVPTWSSLDPLPAQAQDREPPLARSTTERYHILLHATSSFIERLAALEGPHIPLIGLITAIRHLSLVFEGTTQAWSTASRRAALLMGVYVHGRLSGTAAVLTPEAEKKCLEVQAQVSNDFIQRSAQLTTALSNISALIEVLLLTPFLKTPPELLYQGSLFCYLSSRMEAAIDDEEHAGIESELLAELGLQGSGAEREYRDLVAVMEEGLTTITRVRVLTNSEKKKKKKAKRLEQAQQHSDSTIEVAGSTSSAEDRPMNKFEVLL